MAAIITLYSCVQHVRPDIMWHLESLCVSTEVGFVYISLLIVFYCFSATLSYFRFSFVDSLIVVKYT